MTATSADVEAGLVRETKRPTIRVNYGDEFKGLVPSSFEMDIRVMELMANKHWDTLEELTSEKVAVGMIVGYKVLTVGRVESIDGERVVVRSLRAEALKLPAGEGAEEHTLDEIDEGEWRRVPG